jgi:signal transduction histidine kinase
LISRTNDAGVQVHLLVEGEPTPLPAGLDLAAYRIVQESLTNIVKHAPASTAQVALHYLADALDIEVCNDRPATGPAHPIPPGGHGLIGMRERAALYGGSLVAGARPEGGFRVHTRIPTVSA